MKTLFNIFVFVLFSNLIFGQEIVVGKKECNNLFFLEVDFDGDEIELDDFGIKKEVWFCKATLTLDKKILKKFLFVQTEIAPKNKLKEMIDSISKSEGEVFIQLKNESKENEGFFYYKHFDMENGIESELYTTTTKDLAKFYNFYDPTFNKLDTANYQFLIELKTISQSYNFKFKLSPAQIKTETKTVAKKNINTQNYFDWNKGTGMYNGNKIYIGPKGGIFYFAANSKVYVTQEVISWGRK